MRLEDKECKCHKDKQGIQKTINTGIKFEIFFYTIGFILAIAILIFIAIIISKALF
ncbi:hypothetical protein [Mesoplasma melaleucae]|uniref:Uncharacterized protein n=1 Tax=Mesoplasma melaleucae TaxID=81459 RepID=A0A2K8NVC2_9MOLU|nr:hypothetical protein [Mesoplasma melaleucae]ATZ17795.1 hypothetical protein EMELA_v1c02220 [Mesoplasma melaleucae]